MYNGGTYKETCVYKYHSYWKHVKIGCVHTVSVEYQLV